MAEISKIPVSDFDAAVRLLSNGTNVAIYNDLGLPSVYVRRDKGLISDVIDGGSNTTHYAFKVNGVEIPAFYMGKYLATVYKGRALSLPLQKPAASAVSAENRGDASNGNVNFDNSKIWCEANGAGFHLPTIAEYAWIALLSQKNNSTPRGNNLSGTDYSALYESGVPATLQPDGKTMLTLTGSGPATWNDNWRSDGICDLNGNAGEWQSGYRTVDGELQIFADNDAAMQYAQNTESTLWKAILQDGTLVEPKTRGTLKWDFTQNPGASSAPFFLNTSINTPQIVESGYGSMKFQELYAGAEVGNVPELLKALALMPAAKGTSYDSDFAYMRNIGERFVVRGGAYNRGNVSGVFCVAGDALRTSCGSHIGFRPAFIPGI